MCIHIHIHVQIYIYTYIEMHRYMTAYIYMHTYIYIYAYIYEREMLLIIQDLLTMVSSFKLSDSSPGHHALQPRGSYQVKVRARIPKLGTSRVLFNHCFLRLDVRFTAAVEPLYNARCWSSTVLQGKKKVHSFYDPWKILEVRLHSHTSIMACPLRHKVVLSGETIG